MQKFSITLNKITKNSISYELIMRSFGLYVTMIVNVLVAAGMFMGVASSKPENSGLFGVIVIYLVSFS